MPTKEAKEAVPLHKYYRATCYVTPEGKRFIDQISNRLPAYIEQIVTPRVPYTVPKMGITKVVAVSLNKENTTTATLDLEILT